MWRPWFECEENITVSSDNDDEVQTCTEIRVHLNEQSQKIVLNVYTTLKEEGKTNIIKRTSDLTKVPYSSVKKIVTCGVQSRKTRRDCGTLKTFSHFELDVIRRAVYSMYEKNNLPTIPALLQQLRDNESGIKCCAETLRRGLVRMDFSFKKVDKRQAIMETYRLRMWRHKYLSLIKQYREDQRSIIYLDETWYDTHDTATKSWTDGSSKCTVNVPVSRGKRIIILHAGSENGWITNCQYLSAKNMKDCNVDYHNNMDSKVFESWFVNNLLPNIPPRSVIVMDNASYHSRVINSVPTQQNKKEDIQNYLVENNLYFDDNYTKAQLLEVVKIKSVEKQYFCDTEAEKDGKIVLRLPPYHCVFNPIELIWSQLKRSIRQHNYTPTESKTVINIIQKEISNITMEKWQNCIKHVNQIENDYLHINSVNNQLIISVNSAESDSDCDSSMSENE